MKSEWYKDRRPEEGDNGWAVYYKKSVSSGKFKGRLSDWKRTGYVSDNKNDAKKWADEFGHKVGSGYIMIRKVRFFNHNMHPLKEKYQMLSRKWVKK